MAIVSTYNYHYIVCVGKEWRRIYAKLLMEGNTQPTKSYVNRTRFCLPSTQRFTRRKGHTLRVS